MDQSQLGYDLWLAGITQMYSHAMAYAYLETGLWKKLDHMNVPGLKNFVNILPIIERVALLEK